MEFQLKEAPGAKQSNKVLTHDGTNDYQMYLMALNSKVIAFNSFKPVIDETLKDVGLKLNMDIIKAGFSNVEAIINDYVIKQPRPFHAQLTSYWENELHTIRSKFNALTANTQIQNAPESLQWPLEHITFIDNKFVANEIDSTLFDIYINADDYDALEALILSYNAIIDRYGDKGVLLIDALLMPTFDGLIKEKYKSIDRISVLAKQGYLA